MNTSTGPRPAPSRQSRYLDVHEAGAYLGIGARFMRRLVTERRIAFVRVGRFLRFDTADLDAFLAAGRVEPDAR